MTTATHLGPVAAYEALLEELRGKATNAATRNKPTMWAYYVEMETSLRAYFSDVERADGGYAGAALALSQRAESDCRLLPSTEAARLWALGVYARRILRAWGAGDGGRVSLDWLRQRAGGG